MTFVNLLNAYDMVSIKYIILLIIMIIILITIKYNKIIILIIIIIVSIKYIFNKIIVIIVIMVTLMPLVFLITHRHQNSCHVIVKVIYICCYNHFDDNRVVQMSLQTFTFHQNQLGSKSATTCIIIFDIHIIIIIIQ